SPPLGPPVCGLRAAARRKFLSSFSLGPPIWVVLYGYPYTPGVPIRQVIAALLQIRCPATDSAAGVGLNRGAAFAMVARFAKEKGNARVEPSRGTGVRYGHGGRLGRCPSRARDAERSRRGDRKVHRREAGGARPDYDRPAGDRRERHGGAACRRGREPD